MGLDAPVIWCIADTRSRKSIERQEMKKKKNHRTIARLLLAVSIVMVLYSGYRLHENSQVYKVGDNSYEELQNKVRLPVNTPFYSPSSVDFSELQKVNTAAGAWLYGPDTPIDYPVMEAEDYNWYLHHLPDGTYNENGSLFLDFNNPQDFSGKLNIVYGHNMKSGKMFGSISNYRKQEYFDQHPYLYLYTEQENYRIDLKYGCLVSAGEWRDRAFMYERNLDSLLEYADANTTFLSSARYNSEDRFVVLSTCSYDFDDARYLVIGILRQENRLGKE